MYYFETVRSASFRRTPSMLKHSTLTQMLEQLSNMS